MFVVGCMFLFYDCSVCFSVVWLGCEYVDVRFEWMYHFHIITPPHITSIHDSTILLHLHTSLHTTSTQLHSFSTSLTPSLTLISNWRTILSHSLIFFLCNWDNLRRQSHPHFHPFSSSATPHFNLQALVFVFHTVSSLSPSLSLLPHFSLLISLTDTHSPLLSLNRILIIILATPHPFLYFKKKSFDSWLISSIMSPSTI